MSAAPDRGAPGAAAPQDFSRQPGQLAPGRLEERLGQAHPTVPGFSLLQVREMLEYDEILNCIRCGFCLPACPTYRETGKETATPRGRIALMKAIADGMLAPADFAEQAYLCLGCRACESACPSGVHYGRLIEHGRALLEQVAPSRGKAGFWRRLFFRGIFPYPSRLRLMGTLLWLYQASGLQWLAHRSGLARAVAGDLAAMDRALPRVPAPWARRRPPAWQPKGGSRLRVGLFTGCVMDTVFGPSNDATARVLAACGCEVVVPAAGRGPGEQVCCGALHAHAGDPEMGKELAKRNIAAFERAGVDVIVNNAGGCGAALKEYDHWLRDDPEWGPRARAFVARMKDFSELVATLPLPRLKPLDLTVTYQDSCHLRHGQGVVSQPRALLRRIPGLRLQEMAEADRCCGSAGIYNLTQPEVSMHILDAKMEQAQATGATVIVTANPGCLLQMRLGVQRAGLQGRVEALHIADLLDRALPEPGGS